MAAQFRPRSGLIELVERWRRSGARLGRLWREKSERGNERVAVAASGGTALLELDVSARKEKGMDEKHPGPTNG